MMNYEMFKEIVSEKFASYLPDEYKHRQLAFGSDYKINQERDFVTFMVGKDDSRVAPRMFLDALYQDYKKIGDIELVLMGAAQDLCAHIERGEDAVSKLNFEEVPERVVFSLINAEQNQELLARRPHRMFQDLAIVYDYVIDWTPEESMSCPITNEFAEVVGLDEQALFDLSKENTKRIFPTEIKPMSVVIAELMDYDIVPFDLKEALEQELGTEELMFVITNKAKYKGAAALLYEDGLHELAELYKDDLYILPSSIHETIAVSCSKTEPCKLAEMVEEINGTQVDVGERLSNQVYHYDRTTRKLSMATDTPNKSLSDYREHQEHEMTRGPVR